MNVSTLAIWLATAGEAASWPVFARTSNAFFFLLKMHVVGLFVAGLAVDFSLLTELVLSGASGESLDYSYVVPTCPPGI